MKYTLGIYAFAAILSLTLTASADEAKYEYAFDTSGAPELAEWKGRRGAAKASAVRVMTYNVRCEGGDRKSKDNNWPSRSVDFAHVIERENPDVMGFQEVEPGQLKWLKGRFPDFEFSGRGRNAGGGGDVDLALEGDVHHRGAQEAGRLQKHAGGQVEREAHRLHLCLAGDEGSRLPHRAVDAPEFAPLSFRPLPERRHGSVPIAARRIRRSVSAGGQMLK